MLYLLYMYCTAVHCTEPNHAKHASMESVTLSLPPPALVINAQLRVIQYLNGLEKTAPYVRMTLSVIVDMTPFLLILAILVIGNRCVMHDPFAL